MAELHPDADVTDGGWLNEASGSILSSSIDELVINDTDYIRSSVMPVSDVCEVAISDPGGTPAQPMTVSYRYKNGGNSGSIGLIVSLMQGTTEIASWMHTGVSATFGTTTQTLTSDEFAAISDFTDLRLRFEAIEETYFVVERDNTYVVDRDGEQVTLTEIVAAPTVYAGPGDVVGSALAWWGLRAYTLASVGANAVRLREDGGNTEQDFVTIAGGGLNLSAISSFKGANNLFCVKLYDQVGTNHMLQATAANQPKFTLAGIGLLPRMEGDAVREMRTTVALGQAQPLTSSIVAYHQAAGGRDYLFSTAADNSWGGGFDFFVANAVFIDGGAGPVDVAATEDTWHAIQFVFNGASSDVNIDGTTNTVSAGTTGSGGTAPMSLFAAYGGSPLNGYLNEYGVWAGAFSGTDRSNMSANQHSYWGF
jgi:hypothetical protein